MGQDEPLHDLHVFMKQVTQEMASEYARIYSKAADDPGTAGDEGEENWATLLREWLPATYQVVTKGRLIGHDGMMSPQADVLVLKPVYPKKLLEKKTWLAGGVLAAFECKNTLTAEHVKSAVVRAEKFKKLVPHRVGSPRKELRSPLIYGVLAHSHSWKAPSSDPLGNINRAFKDAQPSVAHPRFELDLLCVSDLAYWQSTYIASYEANYAPDLAQLYELVFGGPRGPMTARTCASIFDQRQTVGFQPIGGLISHLTQAFAWADPSVRDIADYYRLAQLWGTGGGSMHPWPISVYSEGVRAQIPMRLTNGILWDEWSVGGY